MRTQLWGTLIVSSLMMLSGCDETSEIPSSQHSFSDEYLGKCFIRRSPMAMAIINSQLPLANDENTEYYVAEVEKLSDRIGTELFEALRAEIATLDTEALDKLHTYCDRPTEASEDMFFKLERIVAKKIQPAPHQDFETD